MAELTGGSSRFIPSLPFSSQNSHSVEVPMPFVKAGRSGEAGPRPRCSCGGEFCWVQARCGEPVVLDNTGSGLGP